MTPMFGLRLLKVGPDRIGVLRLIRAMSSRGSLPPAVVKTEMEHGLPMLISDDFDYYSVRAAKSAFEKLGAVAEVFISVSDEC